MTQSAVKSTGPGAQLFFRPLVDKKPWVAIESRMASLSGPFANCTAASAPRPASGESSGASAREGGREGGAL